MYPRAVSTPTPLMEAVLRRDAQAVRASAAWQGAQLAVPTREIGTGISALMLAVQTSFLRAIPLLRAERGLQDVRGRTALMFACMKGDFDSVVQLLDEAGARDADGSSALMYAAMFDRVDCARQLFSLCGAKDRHGRTALMFAASLGRPGCVHELKRLEAGFLDARGRTALSQGDEDVREIIFTDPDAVRVERAAEAFWEELRGKCAQIEDSDTRKRYLNAQMEVHDEQLRRQIDYRLRFGIWPGEASEDTDEE